MLSVHTSPLDQPGTGDAGGMNVYVLELSRALARRGAEVEIYTRATSSAQPKVVDVEPGVRVLHVAAGPYEGLDKNDLPGQLCAFTAGVLRAEAHRPAGWYDVVHAHYWLSGQVGWLAAERWDVPLVHTMHTLAKVKNAALAPGDAPEPLGRVIGEEQVVEEADALVASTREESDDLVREYRADPDRVHVVAPGVDLDVFSPLVPRPGRTAAEERRALRVRLGLPLDRPVILFAGRVQLLKGPDVLVRALGVLADHAAAHVLTTGGRPDDVDPVGVGPMPTASATAVAVACRRSSSSVGPAGARRRCASSRRSPTRPASATTSWCGRPRRARCWSSTSGPPTSWPCRRTTSRSGSWRPRRRQWARPSSRPPSEACGPWCRTACPACSSPTTARGPGRACSATSCTTTSAAPRSPPARRGARRASERFSWDRAAAAMLDVYSQARKTRASR
jgi:D-inositol-3-phosphate glycosyltransferase